MDARFSAIWRLHARTESWPRAHSGRMAARKLPNQHRLDTSGRQSRSPGNHDLLRCRLESCLRPRLSDARQEHWQVGFEPRRRVALEQPEPPSPEALAARGEIDALGRRAAVVEVHAPPQIYVPLPGVLGVSPARHPRVRETVGGGSQRGAVVAEINDLPVALVAVAGAAQGLQRPPVVRAEVTEKPAFDIGRSIQKHSPHLWNSEAFLAFNFPRFCEDAGFPFRVPGCAIATESATGTLTRIAGYSSYWALATLVRIGDDKAVDEIFDRPSLACMSMSAVDSLVERYLEALRLASSDVTTGDRLRAPNFGTLLAGILPEILSRLCCKSSGIARTRLLEWLLEVYRSEHRANYQGIGRLVRRLLESSQGSDAVDMIPRLLEFPVLADGNAIEQREYPNPFDFVDLSKGRERDGGVVRDMPLEAFFKGGASDSPAVRKWAVSTLGRLHEGGLLSRTESRRFGAVLWSRVDDDGLPAGTNYYRFAFLSLPCPVSVNPVEGFMRYVRAARFPKQESQTRTTIRHGGDDAVAICHDIGAASDVQWATDDVCSMVRRLVEWWDADKAHWRRAPAKTQVPSITEGLERHLAALVRTLATVVVRCRGSFDDDGTRDSVRRVAEECGGYGVPALRLELACAYAFGLGREAVLYRVEDAMPSSSTNVVMDALGAMDLVSQHGVSESDNGDLMQLLSGAAGMIRWRRATALGEALKAVGRVVERQPGAFMGDVERDVLTGLERLVSETAVETESGMAMDGVDRQDISRRLIVRRAAARLARRLLEHYGARGAVIPQAIEGWEKVCGSDREFLEIKNEWLALRKGNA